MEKLQVQTSKLAKPLAHLCLEPGRRVTKLMSWQAETTVKDGVQHLKPLLVPTAAHWDNNAEHKQGLNTPPPQHFKTIFQLASPQARSLDFIKKKKKKETHPIHLGSILSCSTTLHIFTCKKTTERKLEEAKASSCTIGYCNCVILGRDEEREC